MSLEKNQKQLLRAEGITFIRAMRGFPQSGDGLQGDDGYTMIDARAYIRAMEERLKQAFPAHHEAVAKLAKRCIDLRSYQAPETFVVTVPEFFYSFEQAVIGAV